MIQSAIEAGLALRAPGDGRLDILIPHDMKAELRNAIVRALLENKRLVIAILEAADEGRGAIKTWRTPKRGRSQ